MKAVEGFLDAIQRMRYYIGIDPSINSTGIWVKGYEQDNLTYSQAYIIRGDKLTKREQKVQETLINKFTYILYGKHEITDVDDSHELERIKTNNFIKINNEIKNIITNLDGEINVVMEGISYGSTLRTKSIFDLAGLNYMIRYNLYNINKINVTICPPGQIKKFATGKGNANKEMMIKAFLIFNKDFSIVPKVDDIADACFMSDYARYITNEKGSH